MLLGTVPPKVGDVAEAAVAAVAAVGGVTGVDPPVLLEPNFFKKTRLSIVFTWELSLFYLVESTKSFPHSGHLNLPLFFCVCSFLWCLSRLWRLEKVFAQASHLTEASES